MKLSLRLFAVVLSIAGIIVYVTPIEDKDVNLKTQQQRVADIFICEQELYYGEITYDDYAKVASKVLEDVTDYELYPINWQSDVYYSDFTGMNLEAFHEAMAEQGYGFWTDEAMSDLVTDTISISRTYKDPRNDWQYIIVLKQEEYVANTTEIIQYIAYKFTFDEVDGVMKAIMVEADKKYAANKSEEEVVEAMEGMLAKSFAKVYYGKPVDYVLKVDLLEHRLSK